MFPPRRIATGLVALVCSLWPLAATGAAEPPPVEFARDIAPILQRCTKCHGAQQQEAGLRLDSGGGIRAGGDSGPVVVAGKPDESRLLRAVEGADDIQRMPPEGDPLTGDQIAVLRRWISQGAIAPELPSQRDPRASHWSFQRPRRPPLPEVRDASWPANPIDRFILARLEQEGFAPSPEADRTTLLRRVYLDLLGLPPAPDEVVAFLEDDRPDAWQRLVDRLLASPAYGERWGRHWLDLARYADSNGYTRDFGRQIWKYRDWVIQAVNRDLPFDQFTIEQFAGDLLPQATLQQRIATGFHRNTLINEEGGTDPEQFRIEAVADRLETTGSVYLGLTLGCARCHPHKYDPISQREYYQLFAFLNQCDEPTIDAPDNWQIEQGWLEQRAEIRQQIADLEAELAQRQAEFDQQRLAWEATITVEQRARLPGPVQAALDLAPPQRDEAQQALVAEQFKQSDAGRAAFPQLARIAELRSREPRIPSTLVLAAAAQPRRTFVHRRGDFLDAGVEVQPAVPAVLHPLDSGDARVGRVLDPSHVEGEREKPQDRRVSDPSYLEETNQSPGRLELARWLVDPANPLTPRVIVNRHWQNFFGQGLVETENDFGLQGTPPTHPELLDWLATELLARHWSVKALHRLIVSSATYRQASLARPELRETDPRNLLLARQNRLRLEAEIIRDLALGSSGLLTRTVGGPSVHPPQPAGVYQFTQDPKPWETDTAGDRYRRGMYTHFWRSAPYPALMVFDFPNSNVTCTRRVRSNTPLQSLTLANDLAFVECARALAQRLLAEPVETDEQRLQLAFRCCLARGPSAAEVARLQQFVSSQRAAFSADRAAAAELAGQELAGQELAATAGSFQAADPVERAVWVATARVLMNLDEFITRE